MSTKNIPTSIITLLSLTFIISLLVGLTNPLFDYLEITSLNYFLQFSWATFIKGFLWQPITHIFLLSLSNFGITITLFLNFLFVFIFLWVIGPDLVDEIGNKQFIFLYGISGALSALLAGLVNTTSVFYGPTAVFLSLLTVYTFIYKNREFLIFFILPVKVFIITSVIASFLLLSTLSTLNLSLFIWYFTAIMAGYLFATTILKLYSPFSWTQSLDQKLHKLLPNIKQNAEKQQLRDEEYLNKILEKISKKGMGSLTWRETNFLKKSSNKRR